MIAHLSRLQQHSICSLIIHGKFAITNVFTQLWVTRNNARIEGRNCLLGKQPLPFTFMRVNFMRDLVQRGHYHVWKCAARNNVCAAVHTLASTARLQDRAEIFCAVPLARVRKRVFR